MFLPKTGKLHIIVVFLSLLILSGCAAGTVADEVVPVKAVYPAVSVSFSKGSGIYPDGLILTLTADDGYDIYYTLDGSVPDSGSERYTAPLQLSGSAEGWLSEDTDSLITIDGSRRILPSELIPDAWVIRAVAAAPDGALGPVVTGSYLTSQSPVPDVNDSLLVFLSCDPGSLLDYDTGIMVKGRYYEEWCISSGSLPGSPGDPEANYTQKGKAWERPACVEVIDLHENTYVRQDCGIRIQGRFSRKFAHKSFNVFLRDRYGSDTLSFDLFGDSFTDYDSFTLRSGGNTADGLVFKDCLQQELLSDRSFLTQKMRSAILYLNGEYWGCYSLNERFTSELLSALFDAQDILIIKQGEYEDGPENCMYLFEELNGFSYQDMSDPEVWSLFKQTVAVEEMAEYYAAQVYMANCDFSPSSNCELFISIGEKGKSDYADGRWHFILYDTEYSSGLYGEAKTAYDADTLTDLIAKDHLFASALRSKEFRDLFLEALRQIGSQDLSYERVSSAADRYGSEWKDLLSLQYERFGDDSAVYSYQLSLLRSFYEKRYSYIVPQAEKILAGY